MELLIGRRRLLGQMSVGLAAAALPVQRAAAVAAHEPFRFLFITDTHIEPELNAAAGVAECFKRARAIGGDFAIQGGDHVFDALGVGRTRAVGLLDLYGKTEQELGLKVHHVIGNHDCFGVYAKSGVEASDRFTARNSMRSGSGLPIIASIIAACISWFWTRSD